MKVIFEKFFESFCVNYPLFKNLISDSHMECFHETGIISISKPDKKSIKGKNEYQYPSKIQTQLFILAIFANRFWKYIKVITYFYHLDLFCECKGNIQKWKKSKQTQIKKKTIRKLAKEEITLIHQKGVWKHIKILNISNQQGNVYQMAKIYLDTFIKIIHLPPKM